MSLLSYSISTSVFPVLASADATSYNQIDLTVLGTNLSTAPASITSVDITIPFGSAASDLSPSVPSTPTAPDGWNVAISSQTKEAITFSFTPKDSPASVTATALAFTFSGLDVNTQAGSAEITVQENGSTPGQPRLYVSKFESDWGSITFSSDPATVPYGTGTTLSWDGPDKATYQLSFYTPELGIVNIPGGGPALPASGSYPGSDDQPLALTSNTTFTLTVTDNSNQNYNAQVQWTVTVELPPPQILQFSASISLNSDGQGWTITFLWITQYATSVSIDGIGGTLAVESAGYSLAVTPDTIQQSYVLTAIQGSQTVTATVYLQTGKVGSISVETDLDYGGLGTAIAVNSDATLMAVASTTGVLLLQLSSLVSATSLQLLTLDSAIPVDLAFAANDATLVVLALKSAMDDPGFIAMYETTGWSQVASTDLWEAPSAMAITGDGSWIMTRYSYSIFTVHSLTTTSITLVAPSVTPPSGDRPYSNTFGPTSDGEGVFVCGLGSSGWINDSYSISNSETQPLTFASSLSAPSLQIDPINTASFRAYPGASVLLQANTTSKDGALVSELALCDASTFAQVSNTVSVISNSSQATATPAGAIGSNPLIFYVVLSDFEIGVFGPAGFSSTPVSTGS